MATSDMLNATPYIVDGTYGYNSANHPVAFLMGQRLAPITSNLTKRCVRWYGNFMSVSRFSTGGGANLHVFPGIVGKRRALFCPSAPNWSYAEI